MDDLTLSYLALLSELTPRERQIFLLVAQGLTNHQIAAKLAIQGKTVKNHLTAIFAKLELADSKQLIVFAWRNHLVP